MFDPDPTTFTSLYDYESYEKLLYKTLDRVTQRKEYMLSNQTPAYHPRALQVTPNIRIIDICIHCYSNLIMSKLLFESLCFSAFNHLSSKSKSLTL
ncbi:hypothetical protein Hanom_Chr03g00275311 [Helianthus anomalus]